MFDVLAHNRIRRGLGCNCQQRGIADMAEDAGYDWQSYGGSYEPGFDPGYTNWSYNAYDPALYSAPVDYSSDAAVNTLYDQAATDTPPTGYSGAMDNATANWLAGIDPNSAIDGNWLQNADGTYTDSVTGISVAPDGTVLDWSQADTTPDSGGVIKFTTNEVIDGLNLHSDTALHTDGTVALDTLSNTSDWQQEIAGDPVNTPVSLPPITYDAGYILNTPSTTLANDPQAPTLPATSPLKQTSTWDKIKRALVQQAQRAASGAASGSGAGGSVSRPPTTQPNTQGQCPTGYVKNPTTGQCQLVQRAQQTSGQPVTVRNPVTGQLMTLPARNTGISLQTFLSNPLYLLLAGIGLILLSKR